MVRQTFPDICIHLSNLLEKPIFLCNSDFHHLGASFFAGLKNLAAQGKAKTMNLFFHIETKRKIKLGSTLEKLTQRNNRREQVRRFDVNQDGCENENCASHQLLQIQKDQLIELQKHLEPYGNV